jgi:hypothetical protein
MEDLFAPTTRFRDLYRARERGDDEDDGSDSDDEEEEIDSLVELELITGSSEEDTFLHCGYTWSDYYSWARGKIVWISPDVFFDINTILLDFQTEYRPFLEVHILPNEEEYSLRVYAR